MAWTTTNPVSVGKGTKKSNYDVLWDNVAYINTFVEGRTLFIFEDTAPTGWSTVASCGDALLSVKGGSNSYNVNGGTKLAGSWTQTNHIHVTGNCLLSIDNLPAHIHTLETYIALSTTGGPWDNHVVFDRATQNITASQTGSTDPVDAHNHGFSGDGAEAITWRPLANVGILIVKT